MIRWLLLLAVLAFAPSAGLAQSPPRAALYLFAEGDQDAETERMLRSLCDLVREHDELRERFETVSVFRGAALARALGEELDGTVGVPAVESTVVQQLADVMVRDAHRCWTDASVDPAAVRTEILSLRLESFHDELRAQRVQLVRDPGSGAFVPNSSPPEYLQLRPGSMSSVATHVARELAFRFLLHDRRDALLRAVLVTPTPLTEVRPSDRCAHDSPACALVGARVGVHVTVQDHLPWIGVDDVSVEWTNTCGEVLEVSEDDRVVGADGVAHHRVQMAMRNAGECTIHAVISAMGATVSVDSELDVARPPVLLSYGTPTVAACTDRIDDSVFTLGPAFWPTQYVVTEGFVREIRYLPFQEAWSNGDDLRATIGGTSLVPADVVGTEIDALTEILIAFEAPDDLVVENAVRLALARLFVEMGDERTDGLLRPCACEELDAAIIRAVPAAGAARGARRNWVELCRSSVAGSARRLAAAAETVSSTVFYPADEGTDDPPVVPTGEMRPYAESFYSERVPGELGGRTSEYLWHGVDADGARSRAGPMRVRVLFPPASFGVLLGGGAVYDESASSFAGGGFSVPQLFLNFLDGAVRLDLDGAGLFLQDGFEWRVGAALSLDLNAAWQLLGGPLSSLWGEAVRLRTGSEPERARSVRALRSLFVPARDFPLYFGFGGGVRASWPDAAPGQVRDEWFLRARVGLRVHLDGFRYFLIEAQCDFFARTDLRLMVGQAF